MAWEILTQLIQHGTYGGHRSTVLSTLQWMAALMIAGLVGSVSAHADNWVEILFAAMLGVDFIAFVAAFAYFAIKSPDALRSERFAIQKLAIEHNRIGDSTAGLFLEESVTSAPQASESPITRIESQK